MAVNSAQDIIQRAREMEAARKSSNTGNFSDEYVEIIRKLARRMDVLETRLDMVMQKLSMEPESGLGDVHARILESLDEWRSTNQLADSMDYTQEYVSRCMADLRRAGLVVSKREGKTILYRKDEEV